MGGPIKVRIKQMDHARDLPLPQYMSSGAAGMDVYACVTEPVTIYPGDIKLVPTGLMIALPEGYEAQIRPRSGLALNHGIGMVNSPGTIDADYRGEIKVVLINWGHKKFVIQRGERIAQMVIHKFETVAWEPADTLEETARGAGGFGHTGVE